MPASPAISILKVLAVLLLLGYLGLVLFALVFANSMVFPAPPPGYSDSPEIRKFTLPGGERLSLLYLEVPESPYLVYYHHGNGEDLEGIRPRLEALRELGLSVLAWDYPGYGTSEGRPSEARVLEAADRIWQSLPEQFGFPPERTLLYGRSLGGGPATWLAHRYRAAGLILEGTFTSTFRVVTRIRILPWDLFDNLSRIDQLQCPVLFLHGTLDDTVPFEHSRTLHARASGPKSYAWFEGGGHNDLFDGYPEVYASSISRFLESLPPVPQNP